MKKNNSTHYFTSKATFKLEITLSAQLIPEKSEKVLYEPGAGKAYFSFGSQFCSIKVRLLCPNLVAPMNLNYDLTFSLSSAFGL